MNLTHSSPFSKRLWGYLQQRFPIQNAILFFILFLSSQFFSIYQSDNKLLSFGYKEIFGFISVYFFFFMLRVFDEHKDYKIDCINHPERILQKGLVSLDNLKIIAFVGVIFQMAYSYFVSYTTLYFWLFLFGFSLLMAKDFFIGKFLHKHLFVMMFTHAPVTPIAIVWMMSMAGDVRFSVLNVVFVMACLCSGIAFEISRKIKSPEDEVSSVDSYSQVSGYVWASIFAMMALFISAVLLTFLLFHIGVHFLVLLLPFILLIICGFVFFKFIQSPTPKKSKLIEAASSLYMLLMYVILLVVLIYKLEWS